ncbi:Chromosome-associated kinesin KIF4A [Escovopsis weberi]|uniref:Chromosome-associated kinesin KIF4A n=1 Tax=Escovopsis weberi TaxID=150374 RepID=A0A0M9VX93_ESCWE|nr:Chromosome-associated kinesin KIF4A [Escovopsis weberi]
MTSKNGGESRASDEETRTAVRVAVRVRPALKPENPGYDAIPQRFQRCMVQTTSNTSLSVDSPQGRKLFVFDRVFGPEVMQDGIWEYLSDSINAFTQGYNVSLLAYGQSGAGKSYTMGTASPDGDMSNMGVIPRAAAALFEKLEVQKKSTGTGHRNSTASNLGSLRNPRSYAQQNQLGDRNWSLKATYVEIYNEQLRDLLVPESTPLGERTSVAIREDVKGNIILTGLRQIEINSVEDMLNALEFGSTIRQTDATAINAKSSRSHAVFSLNLIQRKSKLGATVDRRLSMPVEAMTGQDASVTTDSKLHFVDLAGSERLKNTGAQGERAKEGISINGGLAALGKVISQLSSRNAGAHVSYRDSKLTRLLQDSLGGNAVTYMIACVTPAEYHLSETLNTVQYAQRARAIQSKPRIQQIEEGDKQAVIDRLKAEVAFLREQIQSASSRVDSPRRASHGLVERSERQNEREVELQNQLLDAQENYNTLNQRHARLIAEMARARDHESELELQFGNIRDSSATDRLNRSNTFAAAVEQVVLEYEKTIQSLEQSLSSTRTTLSNTETSLLEKETKCAYIETINSQLQSRLQKVMDREASTESYLHDLEVKLDDHTSGEEKNAAIVAELRKEMSRIRENEASCEEYISTLEERLAEADQDAELMQREIDRLEQVVERQRSLGKLDTLLYELDHIAEAKPGDHGETRGMPAVDGMILDASQTDSENHPTTDDDKDAALASALEVMEDQTALVEQLPTLSESTMPGADPSAILASELAAATNQELLDLRSAHETAVQDLTLLQTKYEEAMAKMAELQDLLDESRHAVRSDDSILSVAEPAEARPASSQSEIGSVGKDESQSTVSQSLSFELSSAIGSPATIDTSHAEIEPEEVTPRTRSAVSNDVAANETTTATTTTTTTTSALEAELERLTILVEEREATEKEWAAKHAELESQHSQTLDTVEELKAELSKARSIDVPRIIRRKSSQNALATDRATRSFASLRSLVAENLPGKSEVIDNFELNINAAMHELQSRGERIQELESDLAATKKEMESKMAIISGLARERSSLKSSPVEMSMIATLRDQLEQSEKQIHDMRENHATREKALTDEAESLRQSRDMFAAAAPKEGETGYDEAISSLQSELRSWENRHRAALESMSKTENEMKVTIEELEKQLKKKESAEDEKSKDLINSLRNEIEMYKKIIDGNAMKVAELESTHLSTRSQIEEMAKAHSAIAAEAMARHGELTSKLQEQIASHEQAIKAHQEEMELLRASHAEELSEVSSSEQRGYEQRLEVLMAEHAESIQALEMELRDGRDKLLSIANQLASVLGVEVAVDQISEHINRLSTAHQEDLKESRRKSDEVLANVAELTATNSSLLRDLEATKASLIEMLPDGGDANASLMDHISAVKTRMADLQSKDQKNNRMIEELEEQLQQNFDEVQVTHNRLSSLQSERQLQLDELASTREKLQVELNGLREEHASLQAKYDEMAADVDAKRSSSNATIRKSPSVTSLPSPPPAGPLPPLPNNGSGGGTPGSPSSTRPGSKDHTNSLSQVNDDQEAKLQGLQKQLYAERQLTHTLEEALEDLEKQSKKVKTDADAWKKRAQELENEVKELKEKKVEPVQDNRWSMQAVEEERKKRQAAEAATKQLEERMHAINKNKKKKASLNCF